MEPLSTIQLAESADSLTDKTLITRQLGIQPYQTVAQAMQVFTKSRTQETADEIWLLQHFPVFTQGKTSGSEHRLATGHIPVIQTSRGGKITYHAPGQLIVYVLLDLRRHSLTIRKLVRNLEQTVIDLLANYQLNATTDVNAPGVYIDNKKISSLGLRVTKGCSLHGIAINVDMDLTPFQWINPCGYPGLEVIQLRDFIPAITLNQVSDILIQNFISTFNFTNVLQQEWNIHDYE